MTGTHVARDTQCEAICASVAADRLGYVIGSRCTLRAGHSILRNMIGHKFPRKAQS